MEQLPVDIEEKLERLPIIPFDGSQEFQEVIFSGDFNDIFDYYSKNYMPDVVKSKPELYQRVSLYLTLTNQDTSIVEQTDEVLYRRPVPTIEEFLDSPRYLGLQNQNMYDYWRKQLCEIFKPNSTINRVLWSGATGTGKTVTARKAIIYSLYKLLCLRYPRATLNVEPGSTLACFILSVTQKTAYQTNFEPFVRILDGMPCFQRVRNVSAFDNFDLEDPKCPFCFYVDKSNLTIVFKDNFILTLGSQVSNTVGYDVVLSAADEVNELGVSAGMELLNSIDGRVQGRFAGSPFIAQHVMSSARSTESVTREYVKKWQSDPGFLYLHPMRFEVKSSADFTSATTFPVQIGNGSIPSTIINSEVLLKQIESGVYVPPAGCELVQVPDLYRPQFEADIVQSVQDILGIDTNDNNNIFRDTTRLEESFLTPEMYFDVSIREDVDILSLLEPYNLFEKTINDRWQFKRAPMANRYIHCDLSGGGSEGQCDTGLCVLHKEWRMNPNTKEKEIVYVVDLQLFINAKNKVDIHAIQTFLTNLVIEKNIPVHTVSFDQYNSLMIMQQLEASGCFVNVEKVSVDIKLEPYTNAASLMEKGQIKIGKAPKLKKELEALIIDKGKVTRTTELKDACLLGDTKIPLLSGEVKCIKDLLNCYKGQYIIGYDLDKNKLVPVAIKGVVDKGERDDLYCISLDNGKKVVCTGDHLILKRDKTYVRADDLKVGDSLLPITLLEKVFGTKRYKSDYFYKKVVDPDTHKQIWLHRIVAETKIDEKKGAEKRRLVDGSKYLVIHHVDHNKFNNNPDNLQWLTHKEHRKLHGDIFTAYNKSILKRKKTSEMCKSGKCGFQLLDKINPEEMRKNRIESGKKNITKYNKSKEKWDKIRRHRLEDEEYDKWYKEKVGYNFKNQTKQMIEKRVASWKENKKNVIRSSNRFKTMNSDPDMIKKQKLAKCKKIYQKVLENSDLFVNNDNITIEMYINTIRDLKERGIISKLNNASYIYEDLIEAGVPLTNHCVVNIEKLMLKEHVYDIQLDSVHNFMIDSGIFVHNCDALVGAIWDAQMNYADFPVYEFEDPSQKNVNVFDNYEDLIDVNTEILIDL